MNSDLERDTSLNVRGMISGHGQVVNMSDGSKGIVIDNQEELRRQTEIPEVNQTRDYIAEMNNYLNGMDAQIDQAKRDMLKRHEAVNAQKTVIESINTDSVSAMKLREVQKAFDAVDMTASGLAPVGSPEVEDYNKKQQALINGEVDLSKMKETGCCGV